MVIIALWRTESSILFFCSTRTALVVLWKNFIILAQFKSYRWHIALYTSNSVCFSLLWFSQFQQVLLSHLLQQQVQISTYFKQLERVCLLFMLITWTINEIKNQKKKKFGTKHLLLVKASLFFAAKTLQVWPVLFATSGL